MPLNYAERKASLDRGDIKQAARVARLLPQQASEAMAGKLDPKTRKLKEKLRRFQVEVARRIGVPLGEVWSPEELAQSELPSALQRAS